MQILQTIPGSPPPMRGKDNGDLETAYINRITPAYAGKRLYDNLYKQNRKDHPRLCGEKYGDKYFADPDGRITPAYAGKSNRKIS